MQRVLTAPNAPEAHVAAAVLENAGIAAEIRGEHMGGFPPGPASLPSVWVADHDYAAACELLDVQPEPAAPAERKSALWVLIAAAGALLLLLLLQS
ncbi:MAG: putative signal transducing protein [Gemmatimonadaceae bacterium]